MGKEDSKELLKFLKPFDKGTIDLVMWLREFAWNLLPRGNELIYDNYNAVAFGWSVTERLGNTICSIAVGRSGKNIHFGFYRGNNLSDPDKILLGNGNQYRYILVKDKNQFPKAYITKLVKQAHENAILGVKNPEEIVSGKTIVKSVSEKKRPAASKAK
jgi:hypothetical protein